MNAAATAAGYLYATGRLGVGRQRKAERAAEQLKRERGETNFQRGEGRTTEVVMAFQDTEREHGTNGSAKGRKTKDRQETVIETAELKKCMGQLVKLKKAADEASEDLNAAIKKAAEESGLLATVVRKAVVASAGEDFEAKHREVQQLQLAFEALA